MFYGHSWDWWIEAYERGHRHRVNRLTHLVGIPLILVSLPLFAAGLWSRAALVVAALLFILGWILQFVGHLAERKPPEFFSDWRFLLVGARWWLRTVAQR